MLQGGLDESGIVDTNETTQEFPTKTLQEWRIFFSPQGNVPPNILLGIMGKMAREIMDGSPEGIKTHFRYNDGDRIYLSERLTNGIQARLQKIQVLKNPEKGIDSSQFFVVELHLGRMATKRELFWNELKKLAPQFFNPSGTHIKREHLENAKKTMRGYFLTLNPTEYKGQFRNYLMYLKVFS